MSLLLALTSSGGGGGVVADLSVTDSADTLAAVALVTVGIALAVTDTADTLAATATTAAADEPVNLGGRNKLFDTPGRRLRAALHVADDGDTLYAAAQVAKLVQAAPVVYAGAALSVVDDADVLACACAGDWPEADTLEALAVGSWPEADTLNSNVRMTWRDRPMITRPKAKLVSSRYEAVTL
jgi:hypothetical protein